MTKISDWETHIGRRLRLRDLHVFFTVVQLGSMAKAAAQLRVTQPAISQVIADLEHALGVRLLERSPRGVEPTIYGNALLKGGATAFDNLKQTIKEIEFLADPTVGEVRLGCPETVAALLPPMVEQFSRRYPGVVEIGAAWRKIKQGSEETYLRVKLDDPTLPHPIWGALLESSDDGVARLIWRRDKKEDT